MKKIFSYELKKILRKIPSLTFTERRKVYGDLKSQYGQGGITMPELRKYLRERYRDKTDKIEPHEVNDILDEFDQKLYKSGD